VKTVEFKCFFRSLVEGFFFVVLFFVSLGDGEVFFSFPRTRLWLFLFIISRRKSDFFFSFFRGIVRVLGCLFNYAQEEAVLFYTFSRRKRLFLWPPSRFVPCDAPGLVVSFSITNDFFFPRFFLVEWQCLAAGLFPPLLYLGGNPPPFFFSLLALSYPFFSHKFALWFSSFFFIYFTAVLPKPHSSLVKAVVLIRSVFFRNVKALPEPFSSDSEASRSGLFSRERALSQSVPSRLVLHLSFSHNFLFFF